MRPPPDARRSSGRGGSVGSAAMPAARRGALGGLSAETRAFRRRSGSDTPDRRTLPGEAVLWLAQNDVRPERRRSGGQSQAGAEADASDGAGVWSPSWHG